MKNIIFVTSFLLISLLYEIDGSIFYNHEHGTNFQKITAKDVRPYQQVSSRFRRTTSDKIPRFFEETLPGDESEAYVHWSGNKSDTVYVLTRHPDVDNNITHSTLWRSSDYGKTFVSQSENVPVLQNALISFFYVSPTNKDKLVFADVTNSCVYVTTDDGVSYTKMLTPVEPARILFHPTLEDTLLFYSEIQLELYKTDNLFTSHSHVCSDVTEKFYWDSTKGSTTVHLQVMDSTILRYYYKVCNTSTTNTDPQHCMSSMNIDLGFTDIDEDSLIVAGDYILVQKSTLTTSELFVKYKSHPFKRAYFPLDVHPQNFNILNTDYNQIFIATDHWQQTVDLYVSDVTGQFYVKSLSHVLNLKDGRGFVPDIYEVRGTPGVYVANHVTADASRTRTMISYDQGARWQPLAAPKIDAQGNPTNCKLPECGLHLHMHYSSVMYGNSDILSEVNAPGYIMAEGFMGESLDSTSTTLFFSSDNGVTWKALFDGDHYYSIMDHGSAIVVIERSYQETTKTMKYSCTEGEHWVDYDFLNHEMMVYGLLTEPGITTLIVSVYGKATETTGWTVSTVNFQPVLDRECTPEDYITWSPVNGTCLLGQKFTYHRRIASKACHNGEDYIRPFQVVRCPCSEIDFECDYGYINNGQECTTAPWYNSSHPVGTCPEGERYLNSSGYREIASDNCTKDWSDPKYAKYKPHNSTCPVQAPGGLVLRLSGNKQTLVAGRREVIILEQHQGSKRNTKYKWIFGNQTETGWIPGFLDGQNQHLHYLEPGRYKLSVTAKNTAGKETVQMYISVENLLSGLYFDAPRVAKKDCSETFQVVPLTNDFKIFYQSSLHYAWDFGDYSAEFLDSHIATYSASVKYTYHTVGNFTIYVSAVNDVDQIHEAIEITVFDDLKRIQLTFDSESFNTRLGTVPWRLMFANKVKALLTEYDALNIPPSRLDIVVPEELPLSAEVSILPASSFEVEGEEDVTVLATKLMELCGKGLVIDVGSYMEIKCQSASEMGLSDDGSKQSFIAVYVCVPILVAAVFVSVLIVFYYKRKFTSVRRYQSQRNQLDDNDHLLDNTDDDDVEPLDPNPDRLLDDHTMQRTTNTRPTLVMMSSNIDDDETSSNNAVDC